MRGARATHSNEFNSEQAHLQFQQMNFGGNPAIIMEDLEPAGGVVGRMQNLVPTTPGSVFGGSRNMMKQNAMRAESQVVDDDLDSQHYLGVNASVTEGRATSNSQLRGGSSNKSGESNINGTINNIRGSFGMDSAISQNNFDGARKLRLYDSASPFNANQNYDLKQSDSGGEPLSRKDEAPTEKIVHRSQNHKSVLNEDSCEWHLD